MTKYFLILMESDLSLDDIQNLGVEMVELNSSPLIKYRIINGFFVLHFGTVYDYSYTHEFIYNVMTKCQYNYILCENTDKVSLNFLVNNKEDEKLIMEDFLCLETDIALSETCKEEYDPLLEELLNYIECQEDEDDDYYGYLKPKINKGYNLNDVLDKINESGLGSLTEDEKNFLQNIK